MASTIHYTACPSCGSPAIQPALTVKDHSVSGEDFPVWHCNDCTLRFTQDVPDAASIGPYYQSDDYISHTNTSKGLINRLYQLVRKRTLKAKRQLLQRTTGLKTGRLLDMGSGTGAFVHEMLEHGWTVTGLEPDAGARKVAAESFAVQLQDTDTFFALLADQYDAITLWHVLEHVHDLHPYMAQLKKSLKEKGRIFIAVPNYCSKDADIYGSFWAAWDVPRHLYHFSPESVRQLARQHGLEVEAYKPMWFDSFYIAMLSSKYKNGKTNLPAAFINGWRSNWKALLNRQRCSSVIYILRK